MRAAEQFAVRLAAPTDDQNRRLLEALRPPAMWRAIGSGGEAAGYSAITGHIAFAGHVTVGHLGAVRDQIEAVGVRVLEFALPADVEGAWVERVRAAVDEVNLLLPGI